MSSARVLITTFDVWKSHQKSNSSDDLIVQFLQSRFAQHDFTFLRQLPVEFKSAPEKVIFEIKRNKPNLVICCGMAEGRKFLTVEAKAVNRHNQIFSKVNIKSLIKGLQSTRISHDAGRFVCNRLYYAVLDFLAHGKLDTLCIFIHVPVLTPENSEPIFNDFLTILQRILYLVEVKEEPM